MRSILKKALIVVFALGLAACAPEAVPTEDPLPTQSVSTEETEAQALTPLCEISEGLLNDHLAARGTVAFVDQNPDGMFAEIEDND